MASATSDSPESEPSGSAGPAASALTSVLRRITGDTFTYGLGGLLPQVIGFFLLPVYTRFLAPEDYGIAEIVATISAVLFVLMKLGLAGAVSRFYYDQASAEQVRQYASTILAFTTVWSVTLAVALSLFGSTLFSWIAPGVPFFPFILIGIWTSVLQVPGDVLRRLLQVRGRSRAHAVITISKFLLTMTLTLTFVVGLGMGVLGVLLASLIQSVVFHGISWFLLRLDLTRSLRASLLKPSFRYGLPLIPHHISGWVLSLANRLFLNHLSSLASAGLYGIAYRFSVPALLLSNAFGLAWTPIYFEYRKKMGEQAEGILATTATYVFLGFLAALLALSTLATEAVDLLLPPEYHAAGSVVPVISLTFFIQGVGRLMATEIFYAKRTGLVALVSFITAVVAVALNVLLIPDYGALGAAGALCAAFLLWFCLVYVVSRRIFPVRFEYRRLGTASALAVAIYLASIVVTMLCDSLWPAIAAKLVLLAAFPFGLVLLKVLSRDEILQGRAWVARLRSRSKIGS